MVTASKSWDIVKNYSGNLQKFGYNPYNYNYNWLVVSTPLKNMKVSWDYYCQYMEK